MEPGVRAVQYDRLHQASGETEDNRLERPVAIRGTGTTLVVSLLVLLIQTSGCARLMGSSSDEVERKDPVRGSTPSTDGAGDRRTTETDPPPGQTPPRPEPAPRVETPRGPASPSPVQPP